MRAVLGWLLVGSLLVPGLVADPVGVAAQDEVAPSGPVSWQSAGDSYSSGEGVFNNVGACAQSPAAYGPLVVDRLIDSKWPVESTFTACTGHLVEDYFNARPDSPDKLSLWGWGIEQGGPGRVDAISMSFGGNDIGFSGVVLRCLAGLPASWSDVLALGGCGVTEAELRRRVDWLLDPGRACSGRRRSGDDFDCDLDIGERRGSIIDFYYDIVTQRLTDRGQLYIVGYPSLLAPADEWPGWAAVGCQGVTANSAAMLLSASLYLNEKLQEAVQRANQALGSERVHYVDRWNLFRNGGHELCGSGEDWLNGITIRRGDIEPFRYQGSFHPNAAGHAATAEVLFNLVLDTFPNEPPAPTTSLAPLAPDGPLRLTLTGLGPAVLGDPADESEAALLATLGPPLADTGWQDFGQEGDACVWSQRDLTWPDLVVVLMDFGGGATFSGYTYQPRSVPSISVSNETGVNIGDSDADVLAAFPDAWVLYDEPAWFIANDDFGGAMSVVAASGPNSAIVSSLVVGRVSCSE